jgi:hypothetical protein
LERLIIINVPPLLEVAGGTHMGFSTMTEPDVLHRVLMFNDFIKKKPWLDVDLVECTPESVILHSGIDLTIRPDIEIRFDTVFVATLLMTWKTDTSIPVLQVLTGEEAILLNKQYRVEQGYHLFTFQPEDLAQGVRCMIAARTFSWQTI